MEPTRRTRPEEPVAWLPWGKAAFARALREDKPVFLSVGCAGRFDEPRASAALSASYVCVYVDAAERPDVAEAYRAAAASLAGSAEPPLFACLLPNGSPFFAGGCYDAPQARLSLLTLITEAAAAWRSNRAQIERAAARMAAAAFLDFIVETAEDAADKASAQTR